MPTRTSVFPGRGVSLDKSLLSGVGFCARRLAGIGWCGGGEKGEGDVRQGMSNGLGEVGGGGGGRGGVVVATVVRESGSVPRRTGAKMIIHEDKSTRGSIGGGLFELIVIRDAMAAMKA